MSYYLLWIARRDVKAGKEEYSEKEGLVAGFVSKEVKDHKFYRFDTRKALKTYKR